jgi:hypothetical protein
MKVAHHISTRDRTVSAAPLRSVDAHRARTDCKPVTRNSSRVTETSHSSCRALAFLNLVGPSTSLLWSMHTSFTMFPFGRGPRPSSRSLSGRLPSAPAECGSPAPSQGPWPQSFTERRLDFAYQQSQRRNCNTCGDIDRPTHGEHATAASELMPAAANSALRGPAPLAQHGKSPSSPVKSLIMDSCVFTE